MPAIQKRKSKLRVFMGIFFFLCDIFLALMTCGFVNYAQLPDIIGTFLRHSWVPLMAAGFLLIVLPVLLSKQYEFIRCCIFEALLLMIFAVWVGISRSYILYAETVTESTLFLFMLGSGCQIVIMFLIHIDMLWRKGIRQLLTTDKAKKKAQNRPKSR